MVALEEQRFVQRRLRIPKLPRKIGLIARLPNDVDLLEQIILDMMPNPEPRIKFSQIFFGLWRTYQYKIRGEWAIGGINQKHEDSQDEDLEQETSCFRKNTKRIRIVGFGSTVHDRRLDKPYEFAPGENPDHRGSIPDEIGGQCKNLDKLRLEKLGKRMKDFLIEQSNLC
ncbi:uncharacterized protein LOC124416250 [Diprion similis]|uniref:uncharacterized protein LOC124416250 n=1 Tax=Diprion similis TaxID=362088 RepID=UPI001EF93B14|nr:uncharacterized protein LOC124416250 [Diprion similis]